MKVCDVTVPPTTNDYKYRFDFTSNGVWLEARTADNEFYEDLVKEQKGLRKETMFTLHRVTDYSEYQIGQFALAPMPGCCGIVVSCYTFLKEDNRGQGLSEPFRQLKHKLAKDLGYTVMIATTQTKNIPAVGNMIKSKYKIVDVFRNKRTGNDIGIGIKVL